MHYLPDIDIDIPSVDLLSLLFDSPYPWATDDTVVYAEAGNEENRLTKCEVAHQTQTLAYNLREHFGIGTPRAGNGVVTCAGGIYSAASTELGVAELTRQIQQSRSKFIVTGEDTAGICMEAATRCGISPNNVLILSRMGSERRLAPYDDRAKNLLAETRQLSIERISDPKVLEDRVIALLYSSGTTGVPKGVRLSHKNFVAEALITQAFIGTFLSRTGRKLGENFEYRALAHLPSAHISGLQGYFINGIMAGGTVFWMPKFVFEDFVRAAQKHRPTFLSTVPSVLLRVAKDPMVTDQFHSLIHAQAGAAPMGSESQNLVESKLRCNVGQAWGLTETTGAATWLPWDCIDDTGSIGQLLPNMRLKIVDDAGVAVPDRHSGEILVQGPNVTMGYYENPEATRETFTEDGWMHTGDIGLRRDGKFYIIDRKKELIKYKGLQIAPAEIEAVLLTHKKISDAAVIGVPDPRIPGNEIPRAFIVPNPGDQNLTEDEVKAHVRANLASHKQLRGGVEFIDQVPRNLSGKILRKKLRDWTRSRRSAKL